MLKEKDNQVDLAKSKLSQVFDKLIVINTASTQQNT